MIRGINTTGRYLEVQGGSPSTTYISNHSGQPGIGNMRYNTSNQQMEVYDGNNWQNLGGGVANVHLDSRAISILKWAEQKMQEEVVVTSYEAKVQRDQGTRDEWM